MSSRWISHLIYKVCRTAFLIVTFLFSRILCFILPPSFISLRQTGIEASRPFSSLSTASFRHPLVPFLRARLKTRRPSIERGFRWGCIRRFVRRIDNLRASNFVSRLCTFQLVKLPDLSGCLNILKYRRSFIKRLRKLLLFTSLRLQYWILITQLWCVNNDVDDNA